MHTLNRRRLTTILLSTWAMPVAAFAQQAGTPGLPEQKSSGELASERQIGEIIVTAQRRAESLQKVPIAITALNADTLAVAGVQGTAGLALVTPSLNIPTAGGGYILPRIRGVGTSAAGPGIENPVATYIDGVYISSATAAMTSLVNVAQVAVLKGPQGTLFGRNATGGLIQVTTKDPTEELSGQASATYANHDTIGGSLYVGGGLTQGLKADISVYYNDQRDGFGTNLATGADVNRSRDFAARSKWIATLGESTTASLVLDYANTRARNPSFRPVYGSLPGAGGAPFTGGKFDVNSNVDPFFNTRQWGTGLTVTHNFSGVDLVSITAYRESRFHVVLDNDKIPAQISYTDLRQNDQQFSQELQLTSTDDGPLKYTLGAYYFWASGAYVPVQIVTNPTTRRIVIDVTQDVESIAAYGQATYEVSDRLNFTAGLRYTNETRGFVGTTNLVTAGGTIPLGAGEDDTRVGRFTWRLALDYKLSDAVLGYLSYNRGFKSAGYNPQALPPVPFEPEQIDAYEVGLKADLLDRNLRLNMAAFYYDYKDIQVSAFRNGILTIFNAAAARVYGLELDAVGRITNNLTLTAGLSLLHDRYRSFPGAQLSTPLEGGGNLIGETDAKGKRLIQTPDWTLNLGADYTVPLGPNALRFNVTYYHNDGWYPEAENRLRQKAYDLVNASATFLIDDGRHSIMVWGRNIGNVAYASQMNSQEIGDAIGAAPGRSFGLTLGTKF